MHVIEHYDFDCSAASPVMVRQGSRWLHDRYVENEVKADVTTPEQDFAKGVAHCLPQVDPRGTRRLHHPHGRSLGMTHGQLAYGEETRLQVEMRRRGYTIGFDRLLVVDHLVHPEPLRGSSCGCDSQGSRSLDTFDAEPTAVELAKACSAIIKRRSSARALLRPRSAGAVKRRARHDPPRSDLLGQMYGVQVFVGRQSASGVDGLIYIVVARARRSGLPRQSRSDHPRASRSMSLTGSSHDRACAE